MTFANFPLSRHLTFNNSTFEFLHTWRFMIMSADSYRWRSPQDSDLWNKVSACGIREVVRKSEISNLSEVCSASDCCDNNMESLKSCVEEIPACPNSDYCVFRLMHCFLCIIIPIIVLFIYHYIEYCVVYSSLFRLLCCCFFIIIPIIVLLFIFHYSDYCVVVY